MKELQKQIKDEDYKIYHENTYKKNQKHLFNQKFKQFILSNADFKIQGNLMNYNKYKNHDLKQIKNNQNNENYLNIKAKHEIIETNTNESEKNIISKSEQKCDLNNLKKNLTEINQEEVSNQNIKEIDINLLIEKSKIIFNTKKLKNQDTFIKLQILLKLSKFNYIIEKFLISGGQADAFEGYFNTNQGKKEDCIFKFYVDETDQEFQQEINILWSFEKSINIVKIKDQFKIENIFIIILEKCKYSLREELKEALKSKKLCINNLLKIIFDLLDGLIQMKIYNILHLDIKPGNILINQQGDYCYSDFGSSIYTKNKNIEARNFTKYYSSPEQLNSSKSVDFKSDVYSLGKTFQRIINVFETINDGYKQSQTSNFKLIQNFKVIIEQSMVQEETEKRQNCEDIYQQFQQQMNIQEYQDFFSKYQKKLQLNMNLSPFDSNKNTQYFLKVNLFYHKTILNIDKNSYQFDLYENYLNNKNIGLNYFDLGQYQNALKYLLQSLFVANEIFEENHPEIASSLDYIGQCYAYLSDNQISLNYLLDSLEKRKKSFITDYSAIAISLNKIGKLYQDIGDRSNAFKYLKECLQMIQQKIRNLHDIVTSKNNIGKFDINFEDILNYLFETIELKKQVSQAEIESSLNTEESILLTEIRLNKFFKKDEEEIEKLDNLYKLHQISQIQIEAINLNSNFEQYKIIKVDSDELRNQEINLEKEDFNQNSYQKNLKVFSELLKEQKCNQFFYYQKCQEYYICSKLLKNKYYIVRYLYSGRQSIFYEGYFENDLKKQQNCVFKINFNATYEEFQKEIKIFKSIEKQINIVKIIDYFQIEQYFIMVLEKCLYSLQDELQLFRKRQLIFSFDNFLQILFDLLDGLIQLRIYNISDLNIKPRNIFKSQQGDYCYSDFGNSFFYCKENEEIRPKYFTKNFVSQEQLIDQKSRNFNSDVFSLGLILKDIINIFKCVNEDYLFNKNRIGEQIDNFEKIILENMVVHEFSKRLTCQDLHEMFFKLQKEEKNSKFLSRYKNKLNKILDLYEYDKNKDIAYFVQLKLYYHLINLDLINNSLSQDLLKNYIFFSSIKQQSNIKVNKNDLNNLLKSQEMIKQIFQRNHYHIAKSLDSIGSCYINIGDHQNGLKYKLESLQMRKQIFQGNHHLIASSSNNVGVIYINIGDHQNGLKYLLESLQMREQLFHGSYSQIAISLNNIGQCYLIFGENQIGLKYLLESLRMKRQILQGNNLETAQLLNYVGQCYLNLGDNQSGLKYLLESIEMRKQIFKGQFHLIASSLNNEVSWYSNMGDNQNSLKYSLESLLIYKQIFQGQYPDISVSFNNLGLNYLNYNQDNDTFLNNFGSDYINFGDYQNCLKQQKESLQVFKQLFQRNHPLIASSLNRIGMCYINLQENQNGLNCLLESLEIRKQIFKRNHPLIAASMNNVGSCYINLGDNKNGLKYQLKSLQMFKQIFNAKHPDIAISMNNVGYSYMKLGENKNGLKYLLESLFNAQIIFSKKPSFNCFITQQFRRMIYQTWKQIKRSDISRIIIRNEKITSFYQILLISIHFIRLKDLT